MSDDFSSDSSAGESKYLEYLTGPQKALDEVAQAAAQAPQPPKTVGLFSGPPETDPQKQWAPAWRASPDDTGQAPPAAQPAQAPPQTVANPIIAQSAQQTSPQNYGVTTPSGGVSTAPQTIPAHTLSTVDPEIERGYRETAAKTQDLLAQQGDVEALKSRQQAAQKQVEGLQGQVDVAHAQTQEAKRANVLAGHMREIDGLRKEAEDGKIDPEDAVKRLSLPQKIAMAISVTAGGFANGWSHGSIRNAGLDMVNKMVDDNIAAQKSNIANKHAAVSEATQRMRDALDAFGDDRHAEDLERNLQHQAIAAIAESEAKKADIPSMRLGLQMLANEQKQRGVQALQGIQQRLQSQTVAGSGANSAQKINERISAEAAKLTHDDPNISTDEALKKARALVTLQGTGEQPKSPVSSNPLLKAPPTTSANIFRGGDLRNLIPNQEADRRDVLRTAHNKEILTQVLERSPSPRAAASVAESMQVDPGDPPAKIALKERIAQQWLAAHPPKKGVRTNEGPEE